MSQAMRQEMEVSAVAVIGRITTALILIAVAVGAVVGAKSTPDVQRYRRMRAM
jgi:hypothetical protein